MWRATRRSAPRGSSTRRRPTRTAARSKTTAAANELIAPVATTTAKLGYRTRWGCRLTHSPRTTPRRCRRGSDAIKRAGSARRDRRCHHKAFTRAARAERTRPGVARTAAGRFLRARRRFTVGNRMNRCAPACAIACNATVIPKSALAAPGPRSEGATLAVGLHNRGHTVYHAV
jgi:hypothetical protein